MEFIQLIPIDSGWSVDKKFCATHKDGTKFLLRTSPLERQQSRQRLHGLMKQVADLGIPMCRPVDYWEDENGVHMLQSWVDGEDLIPLLPNMTKEQHYSLGLDAGKYLRQIHTIPAPAEQEEWQLYFNAKIDRTINNYQECGLSFEGDNHILEYIEQNRHLLANRPQNFHHGDYHTGNMMLSDGELVIIDFDRFSFGDPWVEFNRIPFSVRISPLFATGQIHGYFDGEPPEEFFRLMTLYIACNILASIPWAIPFGQGEIDFMTNLAKDVLSWYDNMKNSVPSWYKRA